MGAGRRRASTWCATSAARTPWSARMDAPGQVGRRVPRLGRARRLPRDRPGRDAPAGCCGCRPRRCASWSQRVVPVRRAPDRGAATAPRAASSRRPGSARRWSPSAPWRPGWPTRSTTRPPAATRAVDALEAACQALLASLGRLAEDEISARAVRRARRAAPRDRARRGGPGPAGPGRPRGGAVGLAEPTRRRRRVAARPAAGRRRGRRRLVRAGARRARGTGPGAGPGVGGEHAVGGRRCWPR